MNVKDNNFIAIQGWMRTKLNLKGNGILVYALIYGFSQDGESRFRGSRKYIADWCGCSLDTVDRTLNSLIGKGLIAKYPHIDDNGNRLVDYAAILTAISSTPAQIPEQAPTPARTQAPAQDPGVDTPDTTPERFQNPAPEPELQLTPQPKKTRKAKSFDDIIDAYTDDPTTKELLGEWLQNRKATRGAMTDNAIKRNIDTLDQCAADSRMTVNAYLAEVIRRGWKAFYPINVYQRNGYQQQKPRQQQPSWTPTPEERRRQEEEDEYFLKNCVF